MSRVALPATEFHSLYAMLQSDAERAVSIAQAVLDRSIPLLLGCKTILGPLHRLGVAHDRAFVVFVGIDSETDHLPLDPEERKLWSVDALIEKDQEIQKYSIWAEGLNPRSAFADVISRFGSGG